MISNSILNPGLLFYFNSGSLIGLIPSMTSDTTPSGNATASAEDGFPAWNAFNNDNSTYWLTNVALPEWIQYKFPSSEYVTEYSLDTPGFQDAGTPTAWSLSGSNDGTSFTPLDSQTGQTLPGNGHGNFYTILTPSSYLYYRINITSCFGNYNGTLVSLFQLYH